MPYEARGGYVYNTATGQRKNERRLSRPAALRYMRALYANEPATTEKAQDAQDRAMFAAMGGGGGSGKGGGGGSKLWAKNPQTGRREPTAEQVQQAQAALGSALHAEAGARYRAESALRDVGGGRPEVMRQGGADRREIKRVEAELDAHIRAMGDTHHAAQRLYSMNQDTYNKLRREDLKRVIDSFEHKLSMQQEHYDEVRRDFRAYEATLKDHTEKAANYGAKVGETIAGNLKRGQGGRFSSSGASTTQSSAQAIVDAERQKPRAAKPAKGGKRRATARRRAAPKQPAKTTQQRDQEREKKRVQKVIERVEREDARKREQSTRRQIRLEDQKKRQAAREEAKKQRQLAIAQRRAEMAKRRQAKPAGGKGSGAKTKPTRAQAVKANRAKVVGAIAGDGINQAASDALFAFADGAKGDPRMLQSIADELGLLVKDSAGKYRLSVEGRSFVNASDRGDLRRAQDALSKARDRLAREQTATKGALTVFKDTQGRMRWLSVSSTVFKDKDREIVSTPALQADVARSYASGNHGPLRFWHVGRPDPAMRSPGPGLDIGDCDYRLFTSKSLIESGTFRNEAYAALIRPGDQMSLGFFHSPLEPDGDGVYHSIHSFERSITPAGRASNPFTRITVKEQSMTIPVEKSAEFTARGGDPTLLETLLEQQQQTEKAAEAAGVRFKEHFEPLLADWIAEVKQSGHDELAQAIETWGAAQMKAAPPPAVEEEVEVETEPEGDYDGPLFNQKDTDIMRSVFDEVLGARLEPLMGLLDIEKKMGAHVQNVMGTYTAKKDDEIASLKEAYAESQRHVAELTKRLDNLESLRPRAALEHVPAAPVLPTVKETEPQADPMNFFREVFAPKTVQSVE